MISEAFTLLEKIRVKLGYTRANGREGGPRHVEDEAYLLEAGEEKTEEIRDKKKSPVPLAHTRERQRLVFKSQEEEDSDMTLKNVPSRWEWVEN